MKNGIKTIGVIGLGSAGMRHKNNLWMELKQTEVIGYDPDPEKQAGAGWIIGDLNAFIEMCDLFIVASPTNTHSQYLCKLIPTGKPIFMEKPISHEPIKIGYDALSRIFVGYNLRFHSCIMQAKEWIPQIGNPLWANFTLGQHSDKPPYLRDGVILNWSHEIDLALYLLGPGSVAGSSTRIDTGTMSDDIADILLTHENGCRTAIHLDYVSAPEIRQGIIVGSKAQIIFDLIHRQAWLRDSEGTMLDNFTGYDDWNDNYVEEMKAFLDGGTKPLATAEEGLTVLKICLEVRKQAGL